MTNQMFVKTVKKGIDCEIELEKTLGIDFSDSPISRANDLAVRIFFNDNGYYLNKFWEFMYPYDENALLALCDEYVNGGTKNA